MQPIVTVTLNPALDVSTTVERLEPRSKLRGRNTRRDPGGGGVNVARAVRELGGQAHAVLATGGAVGRELWELLTGQGVSGTCIATAEQTRESFTAYEESTGCEYRFVMPGPRLRESEWREIIDRAAAARAAYLVMSGSLPSGVPEDFYARLIRQASRRDIRMVLDTSGEPLRAGLREGVFLAKPNLRELQQVSGERLDTREARVAAARQLISDGYCEVVALTLGAEGALFVWRDGYEHLAVPEVETLSSVGAGDSFVGALVLRLAQGAERRDAFRFAVAAGTAALLTGGTALCCREDAERLYAEIAQS